MQHQTGITITNELDLPGMQRASDLPFMAVLDLRFDGSGTARPVEEDVLKRLRNLQVSYIQLPLDMTQPAGWQKNSLMRQIGSNLARMMIVTDQPEAVSKFCRSINVPSIQASRVDETDIEVMIPQLQTPSTSQSGFHHSTVV